MARRRRTGARGMSCRRAGNLRRALARGGDRAGDRAGQIRGIRQIADRAGGRESRDLRVERGIRLRSGPLRVQHIVDDLHDPIRDQDVGLE